jgi:hypothetical protein
VLDDALDRTILTGGIAALEDNQYLFVAFDDVPLQFDQLHL